MTTAFYSHPDCRGHDMGRGHPECPQRLDAIDDYLLATGLDVALERHEAPLVDLRDVAFAHSSGYVAELRDALERIAAEGSHSIPTPPPTSAPGRRCSALPAPRWPRPTR
jgi:acetoin utilization deacetylase AcuC-like enzyme